MTDHPAIDGGLGPADGADLAGAALALARRFAAGATMWCVAPDGPEHARHVAVEFVHPVIMGKRALPAVAVDDADPVAALRALGAPRRRPVRGGRRVDPAVSETLRAGRAWGLTTVWIGAGTRPDAGAPTTCSGSTTGGRAGRTPLRRQPRAPLPRALGAHPRVLRASRSARSRRRRGVRRRGHVHHLLRRGHAWPRWSRSTSRGAASVRTAVGVEQIDVNLVGPVGPGDLVLVHAGTAIAVVEAERARERRHRLPLSLHRRRRARHRGVARRPRGIGRGQGRGQRRAATRDPRAARRRRSTPRPRPWPQRFADGGRLFTFGNGGSSTDAASLASLFARPPSGAALPARCLADDTRRAHRARPTTSGSTSCSRGS